jgi:hypothetical protein
MMREVGKVPKLTGGRAGFREWVDRAPDPRWSLMPLTHITKGIAAEDIIRAGHVAVSDCAFFGEPLAYFFYGRPAYRAHGDGAIKVEAACPFCFVFDSALIKEAKAIHAFDTGAFHHRLYKHILMDEMQVEDFSLERDETRPNRIISAVFSSKRSYFDGDRTKITDPDKGAQPWDFHARAYLQLLASPGRNEPDDRICSIEIVFGHAVPLAGRLKAVVVPHTMWDGSRGAPWLASLHADGIEIVPYAFVPGRHPDYYHAHLEAAIRELYEHWGVL